MKIFKELYNSKFKKNYIIYRKGKRIILKSLRISIKFKKLLDHKEIMRKKMLLSKKKKIIQNHLKLTKYILLCILYYSKTCIIFSSKKILQNIQLFHLVTQTHYHNLNLCQSIIINFFVILFYFNPKF